MSAWIQIALTLGGMLALGLISWGTLRGQVTSMQQAFEAQVIAMQTALDGFAKQLLQVKNDLEKDVDRAEKSMGHRIDEVRATAGEAHQRIDRHIEGHAGP